MNDQVEPTERSQRRRGRGPPAGLIEMPRYRLYRAAGSASSSVGLAQSARSRPCRDRPCGCRWVVIRPHGEDTRGQLFVSTFPAMKKATMPPSSSFRASSLAPRPGRAGSAAL